MFSFVRRDDQYFPLVFPGLIVGSSGESCESARILHGTSSRRESPAAFAKTRSDHLSRLIARKLDLLRLSIRRSLVKRTTPAQRVSCDDLVLDFDTSSSLTRRLSFSPLFAVSSEDCGTASSNSEQQPSSP